MINGVLSNSLKDIRKQREINQQELAAAVGVTRQTISALEANRYGPSLELAFRIAAFFDLPVEEVFTFKRI